MDTQWEFSVWQLVLVISGNFSSIISLIVYIFQFFFFTSETPVSWLNQLLILALWMPFLLTTFAKFNLLPQRSSFLLNFSVFLEKVPSGEWTSSSRVLYLGCGRQRNKWMFHIRSFNQSPCFKLVPQFYASILYLASLRIAHPQNFMRKIVPHLVSIPSVSNLLYGFLHLD